jgi:hypothetical protein
MPTRTSERSGLEWRHPTIAMTTRPDTSSSIEDLYQVEQTHPVPDSDYPSRASVSGGVTDESQQFADILSLWMLDVTAELASEMGRLLRPSTDDDQDFDGDVALPWMGRVVATGRARLRSRTVRRPVVHGAEREYYLDSELDFDE